MFQIGGSGSPPPAERKRPPAARKPPLVAVTVRLEPRQREKLELLGGDTWLRDQIDRATFDAPAGE
ncbi:MAG TPA: hypothetical protein VFE82_12130 [Ramlibacter sp.]|jgi:hypothetical protein|uniref:hypothetical protein n=1 Tax=Ramlibacter sp. TaxID=1917967 RepID=UPI002D29DE7F|nr:hypothetical protein [Ramlibacter sp.]HZY19220.1 hypothetical protein [Ramlibacter sp.]